MLHISSFVNILGRIGAVRNVWILWLRHGLESMKADAVINVLVLNGAARFFF